MLPNIQTIRKIDGTTNIISLIAGGGTNTTSYGMKATSATLSTLFGITMNTLGEIFFSESAAGHNSVRKIDVNGIISVYAGIFGSQGYSGDNGPATSATFFTLKGLFMNSVGDLYIADVSSTTGGNRIRKVLKSNGYIYAFAGSGTGGYSGDGGQATSATLRTPFACYGDGNGVIYITDYGNCVIRKVAVDGIISTFAGTGVQGTTISGSVATSTLIKAPMSIIVNPIGEVYFTSLNGPLTKVYTGIITTYPSSTTLNIYSTTNYYRIASSSLCKLTSERNGNIYFTTSDNKIYKYDMNASPSSIQLFAGTGSASSTGDGGQATSATFKSPFGIYIITNGDIYISEQSGHIIRKIDSSGIVSTFAGTSGSSGSSGDGGLATSAKLNSPNGVFVDQLYSKVYIADTKNHKIRVVDMLTNIISTVSGGSTTGKASGSADGAATSATFNTPYDIFISTSRDIYVADYGNNKIRLISYSTMIVSTIAGGATSGYSGDGGNPTSALLYYPQSLYVTTSGVIYIADTYNIVIRKIENNIITKFAGTYSTNTYTGDGGQATSSTFGFSSSVIVDTSGIVYFTDISNNIIRKVTPDNIINSVGVKYIKNSVSASNTQFLQISAMWMDSSSNLYVTDRTMNNVMEYSASANVVYSLAGGSSFCGSSGDGSYSINALLCYPSGIIGDSNGSFH